MDGNEKHAKVKSINFNFTDIISFTLLACFGMKRFYRLLCRNDISEDNFVNFTDHS